MLARASKPPNLQLRLKNQQMRKQPIMNNMLEGLSILVTRPKEQAKSLLDKLRKLGAEVIAFPTVEIEPLNHSADFLNIIKKIKI